MDFILIFLQSTQSAFQEQHISDFNEEELLINLGDGDDGMDDVNMNGIDDIFGNDWDSKFLDKKKVHQTIACKTDSFL